MVMEVALAGIEEVRADGFDRFVADRAPGLFHAAWLLTGDAHHSEDLVQTALAKTYSRYAGFDDDRRFEAYVRTTMYRTFVSWWRRLSWRSEFATAAPPDGVAGPAADSAGSEDVRRALAELPRVQRAVIVLRYFEDRSTKQVAELLGMPPGTVTSHVSRALAALRRSPHLSQEDQP